MASRTKVSILMKPLHSGNVSPLNAMVKGKAHVSIKGKVLRRYNKRDSVTTPVTITINDTQYEACPFYITTGRLAFTLSMNMTTRHETKTVMFTIDRNNELLLHVGELATLMGYVDAQAPAAIRNDTNPADWLTTTQVATRLDLDEDATAALRQAAGVNALWVSTNAYTTWLTRVSPTKPVGKLLLWWTLNNGLRMAAPLLRLPMTIEEQNHVQTRTDITAYNTVTREALPGTSMKVLQQIHKILFGFATAKEFKEEYGVEGAHEVNRLLRGSAAGTKQMALSMLAHLIAHNPAVSTVLRGNSQRAAVEAVERELGPALRAMSSVFELTDPVAMRKYRFVENRLVRANQVQRRIDNQRRAGEAVPSDNTTQEVTLVRDVVAGVLPVLPAPPMLPMLPGTGQ